MTPDNKSMGPRSNGCKTNKPYDILIFVWHLDACFSRHGGRYCVETAMV